ncbi:MAG: hypothetical protein IPF99_37710 [Deltaproteobacteria bacterium]|nr:hypothetical protein [Deltaproteobacteria bacterium]
MAQRGLALAVGVAQRGVFAEELVAAGVQAQVDGAPAEVGGELLVLGLALLPAGGDGGDAPRDAELGDGGAEGGVEALGAEEHDGGTRGFRHSGRRRP